jgi:uncharacterized OB-fold protein
VNKRALEETQRRAEDLEGTLAAVWENVCEDCGRPRHPRSTTCPGCELDRERAGKESQ